MGVGGNRRSALWVTASSVPSQEHRSRSHQVSSPPIGGSTERSDGLSIILAQTDKSGYGLTNRLTKSYSCILLRWYVRTTLPITSVGQVPSRRKRPRSQPQDSLGILDHQDRRLAKGFFFSINLDSLSFQRIQRDTILLLQTLEIPYVKRKQRTNSLCLHDGNGTAIHKTYIFLLNFPKNLPAFSL